MKGLSLPARVEVTRSLYCRVCAGIKEGQGPVMELTRLTSHEPDNSKNKPARSTQPIRNPTQAS